MLCEDGLEAHRLGCHHGDVTEDAGALMAVDDVDLLSDHDLTQQRQRVEEAEECYITLTYWHQW